MPTPLFTAPREKAKIASNRGLTMRVLRPREEHAGQKPTGLVAAGFLNPEEKSAQHTLRHIPKNNPRFRYSVIPLAVVASSKRGEEERLTAAMPALGGGDPQWTPSQRTAAHLTTCPAP